MKTKTYIQYIVYKRTLSLELSSESSCFLWGARQTGKSTLLRTLFPQSRYYDLLMSNEFRRMTMNPSALREDLVAAGVTGENQVVPVIIDEVQKAPDILDEVHWLIENRGIRFILSGSSARKLRRGHANLLGGRAVRYELFPLVWPEIPSFSLDLALNRGLLPRMYQSEHATDMLDAYINDYLREEVAAEALTRNLGAFGRFLDVAALTSGELVNYSNIAMECGISLPTVKAYFAILVDTNLGFELPAFSRVVKRRLIGAPRFFLFDVGVTGFLAKRGPLQQGSELFGKAFEHFLCLELRAHAAYSRQHYQLSYWRTASSIEVDFVLGDGRVAIEAKSSSAANNKHLSGLRAFGEEHPVARRILVSLDPRPRRTDDGIDILPVEEFLRRLWAGEITAGLLAR